MLDQLFGPVLKVKVKNTGDKEINELIIYVQFEDKEKEEIFGNDYSYVVSQSDPPLISGFTKIAYIHSDVGFTGVMSASKLPNLTAKIFAENGYEGKVFLKEVKVNKTYKGMDFSK